MIKLQEDFKWADMHWIWKNMQIRQGLHLLKDACYRKMTTVALPLKKGDKVAVFGHMAFHYYKSGTWLGRTGKYMLCGSESYYRTCRALKNTALRWTKRN